MNNFLQETTNELYRWFDFLNNKFFSNELSQPMITIQKTKPNILGYFTLDKVWENAGTKDVMYEINISASSLNREVNDIVGTLLHEQVHQWNKEHDIKDCSQNIHNKKFKNKAEEVGLIVTKDKKVGWGYTKVSDELNQIINNELNPKSEIFSYYRIVPEKKSAASTKTQFKYTCPQCGMKMRGKSGCSVLCGSCNISLEMEEE